MRKPRVSKPASVNGFSLSRGLPKLQLPRAAAPKAEMRRPQLSTPRRAATSLAKLGVKGVKKGR